MKLNKNILKLYAITDRTWLNDHTLEADTETAIQNGATIIQIREKGIDQPEYINRAKSLKTITDKYNVPLIINDNPIIAKEVDAAGVHVGQSDSSITQARKLLGDTKIIGATANTVELALRAEAQGADYLGVGAIFGTSTKKDAKPLTMETLRAICEAVTIPVVAIGGINQENAPELIGSGISGFCAISSIYANKDIAQATKHLREISDKITIEKGE